VAVLDGGEVGVVALFVFNFVVEFEVVDEVAEDVEVAACSSEVEGDFAFGLLGGV
jgi:hypothetical protein